MIIHYVKENIVQMFKKNKLSFFLLLFVQASSVLLILFAYGIFNHYNTKVGEVEGIDLKYTLHSQTEKNVNTDNVINYYKEVLPLIERKLEYFFTTGFLDDDVAVQCSSTYKDGKFMVSRLVEEQYLSRIDGRYFSEEEMNSDSNVYYLVSDSKDIEVSSESVFSGESYTLVGKVQHAAVRNVHFFPLLSLPKGEYIYYVSIRLTKPLTQTEHEQISLIAYKYFGDTFPIPEFKGINNESDKRVYRSLIYIAVFLIIISVLNYCLLYNYILENRTKRLAISRICGCKRYQAMAIYMIELLMMSVAILAVFELVYVKLILPEIQYTFEYMIYYYTSDFYLKFNVIYIVSLLLAYGVLISKKVKMTPAELIREV